MRLIKILNYKFSKICRNSNDVYTVLEKECLKAQNETEYGNAVT